VGQGVDLATAAPVPAGPVDPADWVEIQELIAAYSRAFDAGDAAAWAALFVDEGTFSLYRAGTLAFALRTSTDRLKWAKDRHATLVESGVQSRHYQTNTALSRRADGSVTGTTYLLVTWQHSKEPSPTLAHTGVYSDVFTKTSAGWRFASRELFQDHK
jgi:3-phenylpropionate/cinnamic acid dioxygenase small subunit